MSTDPNLAKIAAEILDSAPPEWQENYLAFMERVAGHLNYAQFAMGEKMTPSELEIFTKLTGRTEAPREAVEELWIVAGRHCCD